MSVDWMATHATSFDWTLTLLLETETVLGESYAGVSEGPIGSKVVRFQPAVYGVSS